MTTMAPYHSRLISFGKHFNLKDFVETGTWAGDTFRNVREHFDRAFTIDVAGVGVSKDIVESERFFFFCGSSGERLGEILQTFKITKALFWLDAHGNETNFVDDGNNQVPKELEAITQYAPDSLVVVDDITLVRRKYWVNSSYEFKVPDGWEVTYSGRWAIMHRGGYKLPENL